MHLYALDPLMHNKEILELMSFYIGSDVVINGYQYWHMDANATTEGFQVTGKWHHDSCGTRVKIFVYLHDVDDDRIVTEVAAGSQTSSKYTFGREHPWFNTDSVHNQWRISKMTGPAGGGFLFDPNTIHRASVYKEHLSRDVVIIDVSSAVKADLGVPSKRRPCPLHSWRTASVNSRFKYPDKGHGPVISDLLQKNNGTKSYDEYYKSVRATIDQKKENYTILLEGQQGATPLHKWIQPLAPTTPTTTTTSTARVLRIKRTGSAGW